jgi:hypothetical protein
MSPLGHVRPTWALAPPPAGVACTSTDANGTVQLLANPPKGCRWLSFSYYSSADGPGDDHTFSHCCFRLDHITFHAWDPQTSQMKAVDVAAYNYDWWGKLHAAWDPRIGQSTDCGGTCGQGQTTYTYDTQSTDPGHISTITPAGRTPGHDLQQRAQRSE